MTFDSWLSDGSQVDPEQDTWDLDSARALSVVDIRDWRNPEAATKDELDTLVVKRRTQLWRMVLVVSSESGCADTPPFTALQNPEVYCTDTETMILGSSAPSTSLNHPNLPHLTADIPSEGGLLCRAFTIPIAPGSRNAHYVLKPPRPSPLRHLLPLQQLHIGPYAIPPELADVRCDTLTAAALLDKLNDVFGTAVP